MTTKEHADGIVKTNVMWSMGAGLIPVPFVDSAAVLAIQLDMLRQISTFYGHDFSETSGRSWISTLAAGYGARLGVSWLTSALKGIPVVGTVIGGLSMAVISGAMTYAIGQVFIQHFESGGNMFDFDASKFQDFYKEQFEKGKKVAEDLRNKYEGKGKAPKKEAPQQAAKPEQEPSKQDKNNPLHKLRELKDLHEKGILSEEEFQKMKEKILEEI